jgi:RNA polymerase sigma-70 factor (ECF subfamily)
MQATALVNEAFLRLVEVDHVRWQDRAHFFTISAQMMRRILVDAPRARRSEKRGGAVVKVDLNESIDAMPDRGPVGSAGRCTGRPCPVRPAQG